MNKRKVTAVEQLTELERDQLRSAGEGWDGGSLPPKMRL